MSVVDAYDDLEEYLREKEIYSFYKKEFLKRKFEHYWSAFLKIEPQFREEFLRKIRMSFSEKFFLLTQYRPLKYGLFVAFLDTPIIETLDKLRRLYNKFKIQLCA